MFGKHEHEWDYRVATYPECLFILKWCECGEQYEAKTLPPKWYPMGKVELRTSPATQRTPENDETKMAINHLPENNK